VITPEERAALREAGREAAKLLPPLSPETCRRLADLLTEPVNAFIKARR